MLGLLVMRAAGNVRLGHVDALRQVLTDDAIFDLLVKSFEMVRQATFLNFELALLTDNFTRRVIACIEVQISDRSETLESAPPLQRPLLSDLKGPHSSVFFFDVCPRFGRLAVRDNLKLNHRVQLVVKQVVFLHGVRIARKLRRRADVRIVPQD